MDILTHTLSGAAAGAVVAGFAKKRPATQVGITALGAAGGALPDLDVISLWPRFDATFGRFFGLKIPGTEIYPAHLWYSHHGFLHSMAAALLIAAFFAVVVWFFRLRQRSFCESMSLKIPAMAAFVTGFWLHLVEDMLTPASSWGGVRLLWPLKTYVGGWGKIWWWNNYDLFLIVCGTLMACVILLLVGWLRRRQIRALLLGFFALGCIFFTIQVAGRDADYAYTEHNRPRSRNFEAESKRLQHEILPPWLYNTMSWFDGKMPVSF